MPSASPAIISMTKGHISDCVDPEQPPALRWARVFTALSQQSDLIPFEALSAQAALCDANSSPSTTKESTTTNTTHPSLPLAQWLRINCCDDDEGSRTLTDDAVLSGSHSTVLSPYQLRSVLKFVGVKPPTATALSNFVLNTLSVGVLFKCRAALTAMTRLEGAKHGGAQPEVMHRSIILDPRTTYPSAKLFATLHGGVQREVLSVAELVDVHHVHVDQTIRKPNPVPIFLDVSMQDLRKMLADILEHEKLYVAARRDVTTLAAAMMSLQTSSSPCSSSSASNAVSAAIAASVGLDDRIRYAIGMQQRSQPLLVLVGGTSGCGKSTLAQLLAHRLGIDTLISTDSIRELLRARRDKGSHPELFASTYEAHLSRRHSKSQLCDNSSDQATRSTLLTPTTTTASLGSCGGGSPDVRNGGANSRASGSRSITPSIMSVLPPPSCLGNYDGGGDLGSTPSSPNMSPLPNAALSAIRCGQRATASDQSPTLNSSSSGGGVDGGTAAVRASPAMTSDAGEAAFSKRIVDSFEVQSQEVLAALDHLIDGRLRRGSSIVVEGVHLLPQYCMEKATSLASRGILVVPLMVHIVNPDKHMLRFAIRSKSMTLKPQENKYVAHFSAIRDIQSHLVDGAKRAGIHLINNTNVDKSLSTIHFYVLRCVDCITSGERNTVSSLFSPSPMGTAQQQQQQQQHQREHQHQTAVLLRNAAILGTDVKSKRVLELLRMRREEKERIRSKSAGAANAPLPVSAPLGGGAPSILVIRASPQNGHPLTLSSVATGSCDDSTTTITAAISASGVDAVNDSAASASPKASVSSHGGASCGKRRRMGSGMPHQRSFSADDQPRMEPLKVSDTTLKPLTQSQEDVFGSQRHQQMADPVRVKALEHPTWQTDRRDGEERHDVDDEDDEEEDTLSQCGEAAGEETTEAARTEGEEPPPPPTSCTDGDVPSSSFSLLPYPSHVIVAANSRPSCVSHLLRNNNDITMSPPSNQRRIEEEDDEDDGPSLYGS